MIPLNPLVSIIIPCYNASEYVEEAIRSIIDQSYTNLEIIIIDDASTDDTLDVIKSIKDDRVKIIECKENTKKVGAVNSALKLVNGDLVAFQDADDWSDPVRISEQVNQFRLNENLGICFTNYRYHGNKNFVPAKIAVTDEELKNEFLQFGYKQNNSLSPTICATMMITKQVLNQTCGYHPYFAGRVAEDIHWVYRILKSFKGITIDEALYNIKITKDSLTREQFSGKNIKSAYSWKLLSKIIHKDVHENMDVLDPDNIEELRKLELEASEEALAENIRLVHATKALYENSWSFKLGRLLLSPLSLIKKR
jgi:glycosyltransferase involved in cell wall biosynthesis